MIDILILTCLSTGIIFYSKERTFLIKKEFTSDMTVNHQGFPLSYYKDEFLSVGESKQNCSDFITVFVLMLNGLNPIVGSGVGGNISVPTPILSRPRIEFQQIIEDDLSIHLQNPMVSDSITTEQASLVYQIVMSKNDKHLLKELQIKIQTGEISLRTFGLDFNGGSYSNDVLRTIAITILTYVLIQQELRNAVALLPPDMVKKLPPSIMRDALDKQAGIRDPNAPGGGCRQDSKLYSGRVQTANFENYSNKSYDYRNMMNDIKYQSNKSTVKVFVAGQSYTVKNQYSMSPEEIAFELAETVYSGIRECDTDISDIASHQTLFKADHIKQIKDHVFEKEHWLDMYGEPEQKQRFDATLEQALAWKRLELGLHTQEDLTWLNHEYRESQYEIEHDCGYSEAHKHAQDLFPGYPWKN